MNSRFVFSALVSLVLTGVAIAHSYLSNSSILPNSILKTSPERVRLEFSEPLEINFSSFKLYKLRINPTDPDKRKLEIETLVNRVMTLKNDDSSRSDDGLETTASQASVVTLKLKPKLKAGFYVLMYRVLSVDTHITQDYFSFKIAAD
jgi:methionine-rich copper-binding protein CopC